MCAAQRDELRLGHNLTDEALRHVHPLDDEAALDADLAVTDVPVPVQPIRAGSVSRLDARDGVGGDDLLPIRYTPRHQRRRQLRSDLLLVAVAVGVIGLVVGVFAFGLYYGSH